MAVYKVPQDVEADDKLLGPFTFRQFIYLIITALLIGAAFLLAQIFIGFVLIPLPLVLVFGALALPIKKDQPMEAYFAAMISFYLKPNKRLWRADGVTSVIEITAPKVVDEPTTKDISEAEANRRLSYLANVMDSEGWSVKGVDNRTSLKEDVYAESLEVKDMLDHDSEASSSISQKMGESEAKRMTEVKSKMQSTEATVATGAVENTATEEKAADAADAVEQTAEASEIEADAGLGLDSIPDKEEGSVESGVYYHPDEKIAEQMNIEKELPSMDTVGPVPINASVNEQPTDIIDEAENEGRAANLAQYGNVSVATIAKIANEEAKAEKNKDGEIIIKLR